MLNFVMVYFTILAFCKLLGFGSSTNWKSVECLMNTIVYWSYPFVHFKYEKLFQTQNLFDHRPYASSIPRLHGSFEDIIFSKMLKFSKHIFTTHKSLVCKEKDIVETRYDRFGIVINNTNNYFKFLFF
jgi:hypothetical protein